MKVSEVRLYYFPDNTTSRCGKNQTSIFGLSGSGNIVNKRVQSLVNTGSTAILSGHTLYVSSFDTKNTQSLLRFEYFSLSLPADSRNGGCPRPLRYPWPYFNQPDDNPCTWRIIHICPTSQPIHGRINVQRSAGRTGVRIYGYGKTTERCRSAMSDLRRRRWYQCERHHIYNRRPPMAPDYCAASAVLYAQSEMAEHMHRSPLLRSKNDQLYHFPSATHTKC